MHPTSQVTPPENQPFVTLATSSITPSAHLRRLEEESIHIFREVAAECRKPVMLYSIGKDSSVLLHLALKAFYPAKPNFPLLHVDTGWKFREMIAHRDAMADRYGLRLIVHTNQEGRRQGINPFDHGGFYTHTMKTEALKQALTSGGYDAAFGGARRDEEKSRAKERIFSFRDAAQGWDPKNQRPEFWRLYNSRINANESIRVFPLSNWTELDIWQYIAQEDIPIVPLYYAQDLPVVNREGVWIVVHDQRMRLGPGETPELKRVRFRSLGCYPLSAAVESTASNLAEIIAEITTSRVSERGGRLIDRDDNDSMERKKREGYF
ncbi:sulfate adenylyltransferase subunit CysD [Rhodopila sp.]|uniref:sulfate adenylyltransferase subunit CysD n=1 Tax=Rhodopila sp. TaxID=2480087 RepID=UPI003D096742